MKNSRIPTVLCCHLQYIYVFIYMSGHVTDSQLHTVSELFPGQSAARLGHPVRCCHLQYIYVFIYKYLCQVMWLIVSCAPCPSCFRPIGRPSKPGALHPVLPSTVFLCIYIYMCTGKHGFLPCFSVTIHMSGHVTDSQLHTVSELFPGQSAACLGHPVWCCHLQYIYVFIYKYLCQVTWRIVSCTLCPSCFRPIGCPSGPGAPCPVLPSTEYLCIYKYILGHVTDSQLRTVSELFPANRPPVWTWGTPSGAAIYIQPALNVLPSQQVLMIKIPFLFER
jgi:hypothetical protein